MPFASQGVNALLALTILNFRINVDTADDAGLHVHAVGVPDQPVAKPESVCGEF